jgi:hypothetical protein
MATKRDLRFLRGKGRCLYRRESDYHTVIAISCREKQRSTYHSAIAPGVTAQSCMADHPGRLARHTGEKAILPFLGLAVAEFQDTIQTALTVKITCAHRYRVGQRKAAAKESKEGVQGQRIVENRYFAEEEASLHLGWCLDTICRPTESKVIRYESMVHSPARLVAANNIPAAIAPNRISQMPEAELSR